MLKKIAIAFAAVIAVLLVVIALQPAEFRIERSADIRAGAPIVYAQVNDFRVWDSWSPWAKLDHTMKKTLSGAEKGKGAVYAWSGNDEVGSGRMEIIDTRQDQSVKIKLDFLAPFAASNITQFVIKPKGNVTTLSWIMTGQNDFIGKAFGLFMNMDKLVGADFEKGLADLKKRAEAQAQASR